MRTLKKTLSLLLAVALVLSLTVVGASAAYTGNKVDTLKDAADVGADYSEAVGVMVGLGIIEGYDDGTLRPETTYTREQAAKIIAYMQLGPKDADSLRCTKAPFTDVAADRWSAGYIAYCVEQGIIDGMGDGTFQPEAQLTGYQWAKMLLCAVGYGRNDEYVGSSWSLNTAKDALDKGIFEGDLVGADHTPLQRQQAILYAFNTLTSVGVVVYSPSLGDYILRYTEFADRATIEGTLGEQVYKLDVDTGIIVDNEAMGAAKTVLSVQGEYAADATAKGDDADVSVAANTGLDMMYHAAKIWHVNGKTAVYVKDLATVEALTCNGITKSAVAKLEKGKTVTDKNIGDTDETKYEYYFIDNTAINANYAGVTVWASLEALGTRSEVKKTTVIGNYRAVSNDYIKTDISEINKRDNVVVIKAGEKAYHVFALGATSGTVKSLSSSGVITLADGTVLAPSAVAVNNTAALAEMREALASPAHVAPVFAFVLDTHGHYISVTNNPYRTVAYFTGATRLSSAHDAWSSDVQWMAQFVDVATGEIEEIPVRNSWIRGINADSPDYTAEDAENGGYYDITDELYGDASYAPEPVTVADNIYGTSYMLTGADIATSFSSGTNNVLVDATVNDDGETVNIRSILFNDETVTFYIASQSGSRLVVDEYTGIDELLAAYAEKYNTPVSTVSLANIAMVVTRSDAGNYYATTIFAYDGALNVEGGVIFFPTGSNEGSWTVADNYYTYDYAYINGKQTGTLMFPVPTGDYERGFYTYTIDDHTGWYFIEKIETNYVQFGKSAMTGADGIYWLEGHRISDNVIIADTRTGAGTEVDTISELKDLVSNNYNDAWETRVRVAYHLNAAREVDLVYVVENAFGSAIVTLDSKKDTWNDTAWKIVAPLYIDQTYDNEEVCIVYKDDLDVTLTYAGTLTKGGKVNVDYTVGSDDTVKTVKGTVTSVANDVSTVNVEFAEEDIPDNAEETTITIVNIDADWIVDATALKDYGYTLGYGTSKDKLTTNQDLNLGHLNCTIRLNNPNVKAGIVATISYTYNGVEKTTAPVTSTAGQFEFVTDPSTLTADAKVVITGIKATYTLTLGNDDGIIAKNYTFDGTPFGVANADSLTFTAVPGDEVTVSVTRTGAHSTDGEGKLLKLHFAESGNIESAQVASGTNNQNQTFTFTFVPKANEDYVMNTGSDWVEEDSAAVEA